MLSKVTLLCWGFLATLKYLIVKTMHVEKGLAPDWNQLIEHN